MYWYFRDYRNYNKMPFSEPMSFLDTYPVLHNRNLYHELDSHYFFMNAWAIRRILGNNPAYHVDIGSQPVLSSFISSIFPTYYLDYRPLVVTVSNFFSIGGDILNLPFKDDSIHSLSCLHVAEHIGLGRYGDPLYPQGTLKAAVELKRVLAPNGNLFFAVPVGQPRICFNAHRIHSAETICEYFSGLGMVEYSGVHDDGRFVERVSLSELQNSDYACGFFWFKK